jgi:hypothetical protein
VVVLLADWLPDVSPPWWPTVRRFATNPVGFIMGVVLGWIITGMLSITRGVIEAIQWALAPIVDIPGTILRSVSSAVAPIGPALLWPFESMVAALYGLEIALGPWAPFVIVPLVIGVLWLGWELVTRIDVPLVKL